MKPEKKKYSAKTKHHVSSPTDSIFDNSQVDKKETISALDFHDLRLLKIREVAMILGCSVKEAYTLSYECGLPTRRLRGRVRVLGMDLRKWLEALPAGRSSFV